MRAKFCVLILLLASLSQVGAELEEWSLAAGGLEHDTIATMEILDNGSILVGGQFQGGILFGANGLQATGHNSDNDMFIAQSSANGSWNWATSAGSDGIDGITEIATQSDDSIIVVGHFCMGTHGLSCSITLPGVGEISKDSPNMEGNSFIAGLDSSGNWEWLIEIENDMEIEVVDLVVRTDDGIIVSFTHIGDVIVNQTSIFGTDSTSLSVVSMDSQGVVEWTNTIHSADSIYSQGSICMESYDRINIVGSFWGELMSHTEPISSTDGLDIFLGQLDSEGNWNWIERAGGLGDDIANDCAVDSLGRITIVGQFESNLSFGNIELNNSGQFDMFLAQANSLGDWQKAISIGGEGHDLLNGVHVDSRDDLLITGEFSKSIEFTTDTITSFGKSDIFLGQVTSDLAVEWAVNAGSDGTDWGLDVGQGNSGEPIVLAIFRNEANFTSSENYSSGGSDIALWKYALDQDGDGIGDGEDNCRRVDNPDQADHDNDAIGDVCDSDDDGDGINDEDDQCPMGSTGWTADSSTDHDADGCRDSTSEDTDDDSDGISDMNDSCPLGPVGWVSDSENDVNGDGCSDEDLDSDGHLDHVDNCPSIENPVQGDMDGDGLGDRCDDDQDGDGIEDSQDSCPIDDVDWVSDSANDLDGDGCDDAGIDDDDDSDGVSDELDNCPRGYVGWEGQAVDVDGDGCHDDEEDGDDDNDGHLDEVDTCPRGSTGVAPLGQDADDDGCNDLTEDDDDDNDAVLDVNDACPGTPPVSIVDSDGCSQNQLDADDDGVSNMHDLCPSTIPNVKVDATGCELKTTIKEDETQSSEEESSSFMTIIFIVLGIAVLVGAFIYSRKTPTQEVKKQPDLESQENTTAGASGIDAPDLPVESSEDSPSSTDTEEIPNS